jgi:uncharacterized protein
VDEPTSDLIEIERDECFELLGRCTVGRVAINVDDLGPLVVPVNFVLDGGVLVFRTDVGTKLQLLAHGPISFEIDVFDHARRTGWSVLVRGVACEADAWEVMHLTLEPWAGGDKSHWVRLVPGVVTGRRLVVDGQALDERGYR